MLKLNMEFRKGILFIRLKGSLTVYNYKSLNDYLLGIVKRLGIKYIVFNLSGVELLDNYGRTVITNTINEVKKNQGRALICKSNLWFDRKFKIIDNEIMAFNTLKV